MLEVQKSYSGLSNYYSLVYWHCTFMLNAGLEMGENEGLDNLYVVLSNDTHGKQIRSMPYDGFL
jgi:hypothetical protein